MAPPAEPSTGNYRRSLPSGGASWANIVVGVQGPLVGLLLLCVVFSFTTNNAFLSLRNALNVLDQVTVLGILAIGMTAVIVSGGIDFSVGSVLAFSMMDTGVAKPRLRIAARSCDRARYRCGYICKVTGGKGKVAVVQGQVGTTPEMDRDKGFKEALANVLGWKLWRCSRATHGCKMGAACGSWALRATPLQMTYAKRFNSSD